MENLALKDGGIKKWYAIVINNREIGIDEMSKRIEKFSSLSEVEVKKMKLSLFGSVNIISEGTKPKVPRSES